MDNYTCKTNKYKSKCTYIQRLTLTFYDSMLVSSKLVNDNR